MQNKPYPNDPNAEAAIIGGILLSDSGKAALQQALDTYLSTNHFYKQANKIIFGAIMSLAEAGQEVNPYTVVQELETSRAMPELSKYISVNVTSYLNDCMDLCIVPDISSAIDLVRDKAQRRMILNKSQKAYEVIQSVDNESVDVDQAFQQLQSIVTEIGKEAEAIKPFQKHAGVSYISGPELESMEFPEVRWIVEGYIPEGLTILAGKPKMGKSWLMLNCAIAVSCGGKFLGAIDVEKAGALYVDLDGNARRLKSRMEKILQGERFPELFHAVHRHERGVKGIQLLDRWLSSHTDTRLIVIDTFVKFRERSTDKNKDIYAADTYELDLLQKLAEKYKVGIVCVHHLRKMGSDDPFDTVLGSTGMTGGVDTVAIMKRDRTRSDAVISIEGKDMENSVEAAIEFDRGLGTWKLLGKADDYRRSMERQEIIDILTKTKEPMSPKEIANILNKPYNNIKFLVYQLRNDGIIKNVSYGKYNITNSNNSNNSTIHTNSTNSLDGDLFKS